MSYNDENVFDGSDSAGFIEVYDWLSDEYVLTYADKIYNEPVHSDNTYEYGQMSELSDRQVFDNTINAVQNAAEDLCLSPGEIKPPRKMHDDDDIAQEIEQSPLWENYDNVKTQGYDSDFDQDATYTVVAQSGPGTRPPQPPGTRPPQPGPRPPQPGPRPPQPEPRPPQPGPRPPQPWPRPPQPGSRPPQPGPRPPQPGPRPPQPGPRPPQPPGSRPPQPGPRPPQPGPRPPVIIFPPIIRPPVRPPNNNRAILLSASIYMQLKQLVEDYGVLIGGANAQHREVLENMRVQMRVLELTALNIYFELSGTNLPPPGSPDYPRLPRRYCPALREVLIRLTDINDDILTLRRLLDIAHINRQLMIMSATVQNHMARINRLQLDCVM